MGEADGGRGGRRFLGRWAGRADREPEGPTGSLWGRLKTLRERVSKRLGNNHEHYEDAPVEVTGVHHHEHHEDALVETTCVHNPKHYEDAPVETTGVPSIPLLAESVL